MGNKVKALGLVLALAFVALLTTPVASRAQDTWSGKNESLVTLYGTITTPAVVVTASTGKAIKVKSIVFSSGTAGNVVFQTSSTPGTSIVGQFYCAANTQYVVPESALGEGMKTAASATLYVHGPGTFVWTARVQME